MMSRHNLSALEVLLPENLYGRLRTLAASSGQTELDIVRQALSHYLDSTPKPRNDANRRLTTLLAVAGAGAQSAKPRSTSNIDNPAGRA